MNTFLVTFKPMEPYFFGNEKSFLYPPADGSDQKKTGQSNQYYIKSELLPSQTTILGALRYLLLPFKRNDYQYSPEEQEQNDIAVGKSSYNVASETLQDFGHIKSISPLFLYDGEGILVPAPLDHIAGNTEYTPLSEYETAMTERGEVYFTKQYNAKEGLTRDFLRLRDKKMVDSEDIFAYTTRTGINRSAQKSGYFKRDFAILKNGYSFGVYVSFDTDSIPEHAQVSLGQQRAVFSLTFKKAENDLSKQVGPCLREDVVYCASDAFLPSDIYEDCLFAATKIKTYRSYMTRNGRVSKDTVLYKPIAAGSIFIPKNKESFLTRINGFNANGKQIGFNSFITK